jgi:SAM-dependent methyltransferase
MTKGPATRLDHEFEIAEDAHGHRFRLEPIDCPTCGPAPAKKIGLRGGSHHRYGLGIVSTVFRCQRCSLLFPNPFPFPLDAHSLYDDPESYFSRHPAEARLLEYRELVRQVIARAPTTQPSLLDVGSGRGDLLHAAQLEGITDTVGLEFSPAMVRYARDNHAIELNQMTLEEYAHESPRTFDAVVLNAIIEHVYNPDDFIACVSRLLVPGGVLYIDTPREPNMLTWIGNAESRLLRRSGVYNLSPTWPPYHVFGFNPRSLRLLLKKHGIAVESVRIHNDPHVYSQGGVIDGARSFLATQILRCANITNTSSNMFVWARRD